jgi:hypothetical protein
MNKDEWLAELDFTRHIQFMEAKLSARKARLLAAAFCRKIGHLHNEPHIHRAIEMAEDFADGNCSLQVLEDYRQKCRVTAIRARDTFTLTSAQPGDAMKWIMLSDIAWAAAYTTTTPVPVEKVAQRTAEILALGLSGESQALIVRQDMMRNTERNAEFRALVWDITGNPFRTAQLRDDWRTSTATALARAMYETRDFSPMPILADALQDAGCDNSAVLDHCRDPKGVHVRGCWVVDALLSS